MTGKEFVKEGILARDKENIDETQFALLLHIEEGEPLPVWLEKKVIKEMVLCSLRRGEVISEGVNSRIAASKLAKVANRQKLPEQLQIEYLVRKTPR
jgi:hypothetical protein